NKRAGMVGSAGMSGSDWMIGSRRFTKPVSMSGRPNLSDDPRLNPSDYPRLNSSDNPCRNLFDPCRNLFDNPRSCPIILARNRRPKILARNGCLESGHPRLNPTILAYGT
ncbi:MAG TPA: hypothetical protein VIL35_10425, partial [Vicinamibacterales bacterium]